MSLSDLILSELNLNELPCTLTAINNTSLSSFKSSDAYAKAVKVVLIACITISLLLLSEGDAYCNELPF